MKKGNTFLLSVLFLFVFIFAAGDILNAQHQHLTQYLPEEIDAWRAAKDRLLDEESIYDYINGAGEVYKAYNFHRLLARRFVKETHPDIIVDFFDMGSAENAFGVFTHDMDGEETDIGQGAVYRAGLLSFWKDRFFVSIYTLKETDATREAVLAAGRRIAAAIPEQGDKPALLGLLPEAFSLNSNVRYFYSHFILNYHFFVSIDNIFLLGPDTEAVLSASQQDDTRLLIIRYPDQDRAAQARSGFVEAYMPDAPDTGIIQTEDETWTATALKQRLLVTVFHAPSAEAAEALIATLFSQSNFED